MLKLTRILGESLLIGPTVLSPHDSKPRTITVVVCRVMPDELQLLISSRRLVRAVSVRQSESVKVTDRLWVTFIGAHGTAAEMMFTDAIGSKTPVWRSELIAAAAVRV